MNIIGIIAEYNPFHRGHAYQIETLKKNLPCRLCDHCHEWKFCTAGSACSDG